MSEYLSKKAVLDWLKQEQQDEGWLDQTKHGFFWVEREIESGAFDAEQTCTQENPCPECLKKSVDGYKLIESELNTEVQRLRAALVEIKQLLNENRENDGAFQSWNHMQAWKVATQALSTTTEPTNKYFGTEWPKAEGGGNDA